MDPDRAGAKAREGRSPVNRSRRALMALSPAALGAAGLFISGVSRANAAEAAAEGSRESPDEGERLTEHRKAYYDRARF